MVGVGYRASLKGKSLELLVGFSHPVLVEAPDGVEFEVPETTKISVSGIDKQLVGQVAADIRKVRPPEPYKGKGIQLIDDDAGRTLAAASSQEKKLRKKTLTVETAAEVGKMVASRAGDAGIETVVFDRGGFPYHGRVKALADAARESGLKF